MSLKTILKKSPLGPSIVKIKNCMTRENRTTLLPAKRQGSETELELWKISDFVLKTLVPITGVRPFPLSELMLLVAAVIETQPTEIFEWGTNVGVSARIFHETCKSLAWQIPIHSIDLPDEAEHAEHPQSERGRLVRNLPNVILHQGDGLETSIKLYTRADQKGRPLFFLDGDHSYASVKRELDGIYEAAPEANFILHDTFFQSKESGYNIGPHLAAQEFLNKHGSNFQVFEQNLGLPGMMFLRNKSNS